MATILATQIVEQKWLSVEGAAFRASLSPETIKRLLRRGALKGYKAGRRTLIDAEQLDRAITNGELA